MEYRQTILVERKINVLGGLHNTINVALALKIRFSMKPHTEQMHAAYEKKARMMLGVKIRG